MRGTRAVVLAPVSERVALSLVSHTNVGKTTLARTLLRRDVGEVVDEAHVTIENERHLLVESPAGDALVLWDTPGFGDSRRLLARLKQQSNPILWMLGQAWDRATDLPLWSSREAVRNVKEESDVVLYLVNAAEDPEASGYVAAEAEILAWIGKPTLVLLNQTGPPAEGEAMRALEERWQRLATTRAPFRGLLRLDAFSRCWIEEGILLERVGTLLSGAKGEAMARLLAAWQQRNLEAHGEAVGAIARFLAALAGDREAVSETLPGALAARRAESRLRVRARAALGRLNATLIGLHGLEGKAAEELAARLGDVSDPGAPLDPVTASLWGGVASGAAGGLVADLSTGGLSFGAGVMLGAIAGGLGAGGGAWAYRRLAGPGEPARWTDEFLVRQTAGACLRYLSVAHFGRGAGAYRDRESPAFWREAVEAEVEARRGALESAWRSAREHRAAETEIAASVREILAAVLVRFYPQAQTLLA
jgi:hypothetical protein